MDNNNNNNNNQQGPNVPPPPYGQQAPLYNQQYNQQYSPNNNGTPLEPAMTLGNWIITLILVAIPCVNIILLFVWAFGRNVTLTKKNYSRAMLIIMLVGIVLSFIFSSIIVGMLGSITNMYNY